MIRTRTKIYAEVNNPDTVLSHDEDEVFAQNSLILGAGNKAIKPAAMQPNRIYVVKPDNTLKELSFGANQVIGCNSAGEIVMYEKSEVEPL